MVQPIRRPSVRLVRSPILIRDYLSGEGEFPDDDPDERAARPTEGDYISQMHRRVKAKFREVAPDYVWPRSHSFKSLVLMLERLGLLERTGFTEVSSEIIGLDKETGELRDVPRAGELRLNPLNGFRMRTYFRLTAGAIGRVEWADPVGHIASIYPGIRKSRSPLPTEVPPAVAPPREVEPGALEELEGRGAVPSPAAPAPSRPASPGTAGVVRPAGETIARLEIQRQLLFRMAIEDRSSIEEYQALVEQAEAFQNAVAEVFPRKTEFPRMNNSMNLLRDCVARLEATPQFGTNGNPVILDRQLWARNQNSCAAAARVLGDAIRIPLKGIVETAVDFDVEDDEDEKPERGAVPTIKLPKRFTVPGVPRLTKHMLELVDLIVRHDWPDTEWPEMELEVERLAEAADDWGVLARNTSDDNPDDTQLEEKADSLEALAELLSLEDLPEAVKKLNERGFPNP